MKLRYERDRNTAQRRMDADAQAISANDSLPTGKSSATENVVPKINGQLSKTPARVVTYTD